LFRLIYIYIYIYTRDTPILHFNFIQTADVRLISRALKSGAGECATVASVNDIPFSSRTGTTTGSKTFMSRRGRLDYTPVVSTPPKTGTSPGTTSETSTKKTGKNKTRKTQVQQGVGDFPAIGASSMLVLEERDSWQVHFH
jgi:hypothetical protein